MATRTLSLSHSGDGRKRNRRRKRSTGSTRNRSTTTVTKKIHGVFRFVFFFISDLDFESGYIGGGFHFHPKFFIFMSSFSVLLLWKLKSDLSQTKRIINLLRFAGGFWFFSKICRLLVWFSEKLEEKNKTAFFIYPLKGFFLFPDNSLAWVIRVLKTKSIRKKNRNSTRPDSIRTKQKPNIFGLGRFCPKTDPSRRITPLETGWYQRCFFFIYFLLFPCSCESLVTMDFFHLFIFHQNSYESLSLPKTH